MEIPTHLLVVLLGAWFIFTQIIFRPLFTHNYDPEMPYFFSALNIVKGQSIVYIDHPGTPVEILGAILLGVLIPIAKLNQTPFVAYILRNPDQFFFLARGFVVLVNMVSVVLVSRFFAKHVFRSGVTGGLIAALYFIIHPDAISMTIVWSHNSFNFAGGTLLLLLLYHSACKDRPFHWKEAAGLGIAGGVLTSVTLYLGCWVIGIGITIFLKCLYRNDGWWKAFMLTTLSTFASGLGFIISTLPILPKYPQLVNWVYQLAIHQGRYGSGEVGGVPPLEMATRLADITRGAPQFTTAFAITLAFAILVLLIRVKGVQSGIHPAGKFAFLTALTIQVAINLIIVLKHPGLIYMLSVAATIPILFGVSLDLLANENRINLQIAYPAAGVVLILVLFSFFQAGKSFINTRQDIIRIEREIDHELSVIAEENGKSRDDLRILRTYGLYSPCFALWFGNDYGGGQFNPEISSLCPKDYELNIFTNVIPAVGNFDSSQWDVIVTRKNFTQVDMMSKTDYEKYKEILFRNDRSYGPVVLFVNPKMDP